MPGDLQNVAFLTMLMQQLGRQTTKIHIATDSPPFYLALNISSIHENSSERSAWLPTNNTLCGLG